MRFLLSLLLIIATSTRAVNGVDAADSSAEVCTSTDADGTCTDDQPSSSTSQEAEEDSSDDEDDELVVDCVDKDEKCAVYGKDACGENPGYMTQNCPVTCNTCDAVLEAAKAAEFAEEGNFSKPCMDDDFRCMEWAGSGECRNNPP